MKALLQAFILSFICSTFTFAGERGTADEAVALVQKAVAYMKANGKEKAYAEFNNPNGQFKDRDLYIFVIDMNGMEWANGANQKMTGDRRGHQRDRPAASFPDRVQINRRAIKAQAPAEHGQDEDRGGDTPPVERALSEIDSHGAQPADTRAGMLRERPNDDYGRHCECSSVRARESGHPLFALRFARWVPAFAGTNTNESATYTVASGRTPCAPRR